MPKEEANRLQAEYFCVELHCAMSDLDGELEKLKAVLAQEVERRRSPGRVRQTQKLMRDIAVPRHELARMLETMGHRYPCGHHA